MKIRAIYLGCTHYYAWCDVCGWNQEGHTDPEWVRSMVKKHIRKTGHKVTIEKTLVTKYIPEI
jgi:uncharacterized protein YraI